MSITTMHDGRVVLHQADCRDVLRGLPDNSIDSVVTDPPYALVSIQKRFSKPGSAPAKGNDAYMRASAGFMGANWDTGEVAFSEEFWAEVLRVLKPGGHVVAFSGTRTYHRMVVAIEDAGFDIRDQLGWVYGSGFPKKHDVSKGIDKSRAGLKFSEIREYLRRCIAASGLTQVQIKERLGYPLDSGVVSHWVANSQPMVPGWRDWSAMKAFLPIDDRYDDLIESAEREKIGQKTSGIANKSEGERHTIGAASSVVVDITAPATDLAVQWQGWGTALKPAWEPICLARKPLSGTVAENVLEHGTGAINIDGCRVESGGEHIRGTVTTGGDRGVYGKQAASFVATDHPAGRWPANIVHDGSDEVLAAFPDTKSGMMKAGTVRAAQDVPGSVVYGVYGGDAAKADTYGDSGSAARFFKSCEHDDEDWLWLNLDLSPAPTAEKYSLLSSEPAYTALVRAASAALPEGLFCESLSAPPSTSATPKQLRNLVESFIDATKNIAARFLREWQQERLSQMGSLVNVVATRSPTGTTQITVSHWTSSGCADPVIFNIMPTSSAVGAKDSAQSTAGRFLYNPKASRADRDAGLECSDGRKNTHPTVKPTSLMQWLCRLITPPGGVILDPFMGSGSTGKAAVLEGFLFVGCEREDEYMPIATARIAWAIGAADKDEPQHAARPAVAPQQPAANDNAAKPADLFSSLGEAA